MKNRLCRALLICLPLAAPAHGQSWQTVGEGTMKWMFLELYQIRLLSADGRYQQGRYPLALEITYRRAIPASRLLQATREQWQHLGLDDPRQENWLSQLAGLWPDVDKGDVLRLELDADAEHLFLYNGRVLGAVEHRDFGPAFLAIWLSPASSEPELRRQLLASP